MNSDTYWQKQGDEPLFSDLAWSRPQNRLQAGKLLIIGGHAHGFNAPAEAYAAAEKAGIGTARVMLPDHLRSRLVKLQGYSPSTEFAPSTPSGSFAARALAEFLDASLWSDGVLLAGDLGRNSETAIVLEKLATKYSGLLVIAKDAADYFTTASAAIAARPNTSLVLTIAQLQKLASSLKFPRAFTFSMALLQLVDTLHEFSLAYPHSIVLKHLDYFVVAYQGKVSTTKAGMSLEDSWRVSTAAHAAVWLIQNPSKPFEALTTAVVSQ